MSNNIDKDIEIVEKIKQGIKADIKAPNVTVRNIAEKKVQAIETVLQALENSVSKDVIREHLEIEQERFNVYKKESETNENLKSGMWHHMEAKNMCERLLGIEKTVTLD